MQARLLKNGDEIILIYKSGDIVTLNEAGVKDFFLNADKLARQNRRESEVSLNLLEASKKAGETLAYLDSSWHLVITDMDYYRSIMGKPTVYLTAEEYGELHGKKRGIIMRLCRDRRLKGATKKGDIWLIPSDSPYPKDARLGSRIEPVE